MNKPPVITRTCLVCGLEKTIAAFLQISGSHGTTYGNICSTCRSASAKNKLLSKQDEETQRGSSGLRINAKAKIYQELQQKAQEKKSAERKVEEKKTQEKIVFEKTEQKELKEKAEKDHRTTYIEAKKHQGFLSHPQKEAPHPVPTPVKDIQTKEAIIKETFERQEKLTKIDLSQQFLDSQFGELKYQSEAFKAYKTWLGPSANFRTAERLREGKKEKDAFVDYLEKNFKSTSPRRKGS